MEMLWLRTKYDSKELAKMCQEGLCPCNGFFCPFVPFFSEWVVRCKYVSAATWDSIFDMQKRVIEGLKENFPS